MKYKSVANNGEIFEFESKKELTGVIFFENEGKMGCSVTSAKSPQSRLDALKGIKGRDWLSNWHLGEFSKS